METACVPPPPSYGQETGNNCHDARDNDCNGDTDDCSTTGGQCNYNLTGAGVCGHGYTQTANGTCTPPSTFETVETSCDGLDNDCDNAIDEHCPCDFNGSAPNYGVCSDGQYDFTGWDCFPPNNHEPNDEVTCDGLDNDRDGMVDEGFDQDGDTYPNEADCQFLLTDVDCDDTDATVLPGAPELCDGKDNNCDGVIDEGCP